MSALRGEAGAAGSGGSGGAAAKRPRWIAATAAALLVGGGAAAIAMAMSGSSDTKGNAPVNQPVATTSSSSSASTPSASTRAAAVGTLSFAAATDLPAVPVAVQGAPRAVVLRDAGGSATLYVFVTGSDGDVWYLADGHGWTQLHGLRVGMEPAVVSTAPGRLDVFAVAASDGQVYQRSLSDGAWSARWTPVGQVRLHSGPAALATQSGGIVVAGEGPGRTLVTSTLDSGSTQWGDWTPVPGVGDVGAGVALVPSASTSGDYTVYVFLGPPTRRSWLSTSAADRGLLLSRPR